MPSHDITLLSRWSSMFCLRVLIALREKGIEFEYQEEDLFNKSQLLLESNPIHKKVPVLIHNGKPLAESLIVLQYLDEEWPSKRLLPEGPYERALARFWADFVDKKFFDAIRQIMRSEAGEGEEQAVKYLTESLITLDKAFLDLSGGKPYYGGDCLGLVDVTLASYMEWLKAMEELSSFKFPDEKECPHLSAWAKSVEERASVKEASALAPAHKVLEWAREIRKRRL